MKKQIWHIEIEYEWNAYRMVRGIKKETKKSNKGSIVTTCVGDTIEEMNNNDFLLSSLKLKIKTSQSVEVKITGWKWREKIGMSNDVY